jgi:hypothetical protein
MKPSRVPSGHVKETAGMGGDKMMVDIDAFLDEREPIKETNSKDNNVKGDDADDKKKEVVPQLKKSDSEVMKSKENETSLTDSIPSPRIARKTAADLNPDRHVSVDLGAFLDDLKEKTDPQQHQHQSSMKGANSGGNNKQGKSLTQRHPRVSIAGVTDVQEAPKVQHHHHKGRGRKREPVTENEAKEARRHMKELRENQGLKGLVTFLKKNAGVGANDEVT